MAGGKDSQRGFKANSSCRLYSTSMACSPTADSFGARQEKSGNASASLTLWASHSLGVSAFPELAPGSREKTAPWSIASCPQDANSARHKGLPRQGKRVARIYAANSRASTWPQICFMGDDVNDLPAMKVAGLSAAPSTAMSDVLTHADFVAKSAGGNGAARELVEALLKARGLSAREVYSKA